MRHVQDAAGGRFYVESSKGAYETRALAIAIGIFGRPNKPKEYRFPPALKDRLLFDMTSQHIENEDVLVVGGGDSAAEYVEYLGRQGNRVTLSYRGSVTPLDDREISQTYFDRIRILLEALFLTSFQRPD